VASALNPKLKDLIQRGRQGRRSIRFKITFKIWLLLLVVFGLTNLAVNLLAVRLVLQHAKLYMGSSSTIFAYAMDRWLDGIRLDLENEASLPAFQSLDPQRIKPQLDRLAQLYPYRYWRVWSPSGQLLAYTGKGVNLLAAEQSVSRSKHFKQALSGSISYGAVRSSAMIGQDCLAYIVPIYRRGSLPAMAGQRADGLLSFCLPLASLKKELEIDRMAKDLNASLVRDSAADQTLNLMSQYLVGDNGVVLHLLGPHLGRGPSSDRLHSVAAGNVDGRLFENSKALDALISAVTDQRALQRLTWQGVPFFSFSTPIEGRWRLVTLITEDELFYSLRSVSALLLKLHITALFVITLSLYVTGGNLLKPLQFVAHALRRFREGQFQLILPAHKQDQMGVLLEDLRDTGLQLDDLLKKQAISVRRDLQIETARRIQGDFLVRSLPCDPRFGLAAFSAPALDVGADWYDAMTIGDQTLLVVADVCDKGVGSALYMSVFRTLVRYGIQHALADSDDDASNVISNVLNLVNAYMIGNHGGSAMFATAFVALYHADSKRLDYVLAGQEPPLLRQGNALVKLETCGPALGLFEASYVTRQCQLAPGDLLLAYSDGLVDARSETDESFGLERAMTYLTHLDASSLDAQTALDGLVDLTRRHIGKADQFDDLTLMTLLIRS
jgi:sigma-B regulation protein RsbU (phosphoserine phosphatase)